MFDILFFTIICDTIFKMCNIILKIVLTFCKKYYIILSKGWCCICLKQTNQKESVSCAWLKNRTNKIINMVQLLGNCSNTSTYEYSDSDIEKIFNAIENSVRDAKRKFSKSETTKTTKFTLR